MNSTRESIQLPAFLELEPKKDVLILQDELIVENIFMYTTLFLAFVGSVTNALNIKTFHALGVEDGVTVSLLALSLSDFGVCISGTLNAFAFFTKKVAIRNGIVFYMDTMVVEAFLVIIRNAFYAMTSLTTTFLAVARCMCVAKPLHFKNVFTKSRSITVHFCFAVISAGGYIAVLTQMGAKRAFDARFNTTRYVAWFSDMREEVKDVVFLIFDIISTFTTQVVLIVCVVVMAHSLSRSGKFRQATKAQANGCVLEKQTFKLSGKELQVVQQVVLISTMCILCALPKICAAVYTIVEPEFDVAKKLHNDYIGVIHVRLNMELINSATTFFIYYRYNTKFRSLCFRYHKEK